MSRKLLRLGALIALALAVLLTQSGCTGGRGTVRFDDLEYPASMSGYLYGPDQRSLSPKKLEVVGEFSQDARFWGMLFSMVPLNGSLDLSDEINREIAQADGDGVINLSVRSDGCGLNYIPALSLLPFWPGCADVTVEGQIVKRKRVRRAARRR